MKIVRIAILFILTPFTVSLWAQVKSVKENNVNFPIITFEKNLHDFGVINEGDIVTTSFRFTNTGKSSLVIKSIKTSPGCTLLKGWKKIPIIPGEKSQFTIVFDTSSQTGKLHKPISILCNTKKAEEVIYINAQVTSNKQKKPLPPYSIRNKFVIVENKTYKKELDLIAEAGYQMDIESEKEEKIRLENEALVRKQLKEKKLEEEKKRNNKKNGIRAKVKKRNKELQALNEKNKQEALKRRLEEKEKKLALIKEKNEREKRKIMEERLKKKVAIKKSINSKNVKDKKEITQDKGQEKLNTQKLKAENERLLKEKAEFAKLEAEKQAKLKAQKLKAENERLLKEKAELDKLEAEKQAKLKAQKLKAENEKRLKEKEELAKLEAQKLKAENERLLKEKEELAKLEAEKQVKLKAQRLKAENEKLLKEKAELAKLEAENERLLKETKENKELKNDLKKKSKLPIKNNKPPTRRVKQKAKKEITNDKYGAEIASYQKDIDEYNTKILDKEEKLKKATKKGKLTVKDIRKKEAEIQNFKNKITNLDFIISQLKKERE